MPVPVAGMEKCSLSDFPGYPSLVLFTAGCNYDCFFCHNRGLLGQPPCLDASYVRAFVERRAGLLDGAVVTGGEPTLHTGLPQLLRWLRQLGYRIKLDTNGSHPERLRAVLEEKLCDYVAVDWKAPSDQYAAVCGRDMCAEPVRETIGLLRDAGVPFEVRTTLHPLLDGEALCRMAAELPLLPRYVLNRYRIPDKFLEGDAARIHSPVRDPETYRMWLGEIRRIQPRAIMPFLD